MTINEGGSKVVKMFIDGKQVGDDLRDNRYDDDGYRFHDVFHLTYASVLGWSPILRALLRRKRKSNPAVDEVEDGGRARVIEEGIAAMVFSYAERRNFLEGAEGSQLRTAPDNQRHDGPLGGQLQGRGGMGKGNHGRVSNLAASP